MPAYSAAEWESLFVAEAGASAALAGLLFVALSINLERILKGTGLPGRAGEAIVLLLTVLVVSTFGLVPGQSPRVLGARSWDSGCSPG
jgi:modulator of FtsH protease